MPNHQELSRRKLLGALGGVGLASVGSGLGTSAYLNDTETSSDNEVVAGELDLKVDWQEHYYRGKQIDGVRTLGGSARPQDGEWGLPWPEDPQVIASTDEAVYDLMDTTSVDAWPDEDGDGVQDLILSREQLRQEYSLDSPEEIEARYRRQFADLPDDVSGRKPLIDLADVKPGDWGEVTFSLHLFDNPGYLWLLGALEGSSENEIVEPEKESGDDDQAVELLDEIQVAIWHDDGDNIAEDDEVVYSPHSVDSGTTIRLSGEEALVVRGTLREVLDALADGIPLDADPSTPKRECFPNSTTRYLGFAWWLPHEVGNEVQTDSVTFDLGFYTEQCRHNDGEGSPPKPGGE